MNRQLIDETPCYRFERLQGNGAPAGDLELATELSTTFVHKGRALLSVDSKSGARDIEVQEGQGFIVVPGVSYRVTGDEGMVAYTVSSGVSPGKPIVEIIDDGKGRREVELLDYRIVESPKRVDKPWGHELWVSWFRDYHVLKQIGMNRGNQSSLQFHRKKLETNCLESGEATVIEGYKLNPSASEDEVQASSRGVDFDKFKKTMEPGDHWTSEPGTVHRVIAKTNYLAYEVSTSQLDDVIRIQDDTGRTSGRIASEHGGGN